MTMRAAFMTLVAALILLPVAAVRAQFGDTTEVIASANRAYASGDFETAISLYESLLAEGVSDAGVYFNLATGYQQVGQNGLALLNYRRAQRFIPRDSLLSVRVAEIQNERQNVQADETVIIDRLGTIVSPVMTTGELAALSFTVWLLWFGLGTASVLMPMLRVTLRPVLIVAGVVMLGLVVLLGSRLYVDAYRPAAVVTVERVAVFSGPDERYLEMFTLSEAAELRVVVQEGGYLRIVLPDGRQGWVQQGTITLVRS
ncbi:MAG: hypothetical protein AAF787_16615 [Chloroflexota bacterium]